MITTQVIDCVRFLHSRCVCLFVWVGVCVYVLRMLHCHIAATHYLKIHRALQRQPTLVMRVPQHVAAQRVPTRIVATASAAAAALAAGALATGAAAAAAAPPIVRHCVLSGAQEIDC